MRNVRQEVAHAIQRDIVVQTTKVKPRADGGKQLVSVGPYHKAVGGKSYAIITKNDVNESTSALTVAGWFVSFVGHDLAWSAVRRAYSKKGLPEEIARMDAGRHPSAIVRLKRAG